jgi:predicted nucleic acid-binding protein
LVLANVIGDDGPDGQRARREVRAAGDLAAPDLVDPETVAVLRKRWLAGTIADDRFAAAVRDLEDLDLDRYPALRFMRRAWELRANVLRTTRPMWRSPRSLAASCGRRTSGSLRHPALPARSGS